MIAYVICHTGIKPKLSPGRNNQYECWTLVSSLAKDLQKEPTWAASMKTLDNPDQVPLLFLTAPLTGLFVSAHLSVI